MSYKNNKRVFPKNISKLFLITFFIPAVFFTACNEEPDFLGRDLLPPSDNLDIQLNEYTLINTYTEQSNPAITGFQSIMSIGTRNDEIFGSTKADFILKYRLSGPYTVNIESIDSVFLNLDLFGFSGDSTITQNIKIYDLTDTLSYDSLFLSDFNPDGMYNPLPIAEFQLNPLEDSVLSIHIQDPGFISKFENAEDSIFSEIAYFEDFFYGLYFTADSLSGEGAMQYINIASSNSGLSLAYTDTSGTKGIIRSIITETIPKVNMFQHNFEGKRINENLGNEQTQDSILFLKSLAGTNVRIEFPDIDSWKDSIPVAINQAKLIIPVDTSLLSNDDWYPEKCRLYYLDDNNKYQSIFDHVIDNSNNKFYADGNYDKDKKAYHFNVGYHLQSYLEGKTDHFNFVLIPSNQATYYSKVVLKSPFTTDNSMYLKIVYTRL